MLTQLQPTTASAGHAERLFGGDKLFLRYNLQTRKWYANARYSRIDDSIRTGAEFNRQIGNDRSEFEVGRSWIGHGGDWWKTKTFRTIYEFTQNNDGQVLADRTTTEIGIVGVIDYTVQVQYHNGREIQAGRLVDFDRVVLTGNIKPGDDLEMGIEAQVGDKMHVVSTRPAEQQKVRPFLNWNLNERLVLQLVSTHVELGSKEGQEIFDARVVDVHLTWQFDDRGSIRLSRRQRDVERNPDAYVGSVEELTHDVGGELLYSWKLNQQTDFNLGFSDSYNKDFDPGAIRPMQRNWFMRLGYTLTF